MDELDMVAKAGQARDDIEAMTKTKKKIRMVVDNASLGAPASSSAVDLYECESILGREAIFVTSGRVRGHGA